MTKRKYIRVELADWQIDLLKPMKQKVERAYNDGAPGILTGQIYFKADGTASMICVFIDHAEAVKLVAITNPGAVPK